MANLTNISYSIGEPTGSVHYGEVFTIPVYISRDLVGGSEGGATGNIATFNIGVPWFDKDILEIVGLKSPDGREFYSNDLEERGLSDSTANRVFYGGNLMPAPGQEGSVSISKVNYSLWLAYYD